MAAVRTRLPLILMNAEGTTLTVMAACGAVVLAAASLLVLAVGQFVHIDVNPFQSGEDLIIAPALALFAVVAALYAWFETPKRETLHRRALRLALGVFILSAGYTSLFLLAYSNCPGGAC
jgi:hypothetical protein